MIGTLIHHYRIVDQIGEGGMGVVYRAEDERLGRQVALKFLPPDMVRDDHARARFLNEARAASALEHRNVCVIHDIAETDDGQLYILMPYYRGESLQSRLRRGPLPPAEAVDVLRQVCAGLSRAHERGILHRDLKPANVFLTDEGDVKILDFGVAKLSEEHGLTRGGMVVGTLGYMAPEQLTDDVSGVASEVWSLGVLLYETLTGVLPFEARTRASMVTSILSKAPDLVRVRRAAGNVMMEIVGRCLRREPAERYASVEELGTDLREALFHFAPGLTEANASLSGGDATAVLLSPVRSQQPGAERTTLGQGRQTTGSLVVGREAELETLANRLGETLEEGVRVALVHGEEGRGKSTLVAELCRRAEAAGQFVAAIGRSEATARASDPYRPFRSILVQLAGSLDGLDSAGSTTRAHLDRMRHLGSGVARDIVRSGPLLVGNLVSVEELRERARTPSGEPAEWLSDLEALAEARAAGPGPDVERSELFEHYTRVVQHVAERQPLILVVEDLHWTDSGSVALLTHLARHLGPYPVFLVGTYRQEEIVTLAGQERHPLEPAVNELVRTFGPIDLDLDRSDSPAFVDALLDAQPNHLGAEFRERLLRCTGGVPLFTTELVREMRDDGVLARDEEGAWVVAKPVDWDRLPRRVEAVVAERVGRLPEELRSLLVTASVQGQEFGAEVVARVLGRDDREVVGMLSNDAARRYRLVTASGVRRVAGRRQSLYRFQHAAFQSYLYGSLDEVQVALLHEDTAHEMIAAYGADTDEIVPELAGHFRRAGATDEAVTYLRRAGERAARLSAHAEAIRSYEAALEELALLPAGAAERHRELELLTALAAVQIPVHGYASEAVETTYLRARELAEGLPDASEFPLLWGLFAFSAVRGEHERALPLAERMLEGAPEEESALERVQSEYAVGLTSFFTGELERSLGHLEVAAAPREPEVGQALALAFSQDSRKVAAAFSSWATWLVGEPAAARSRARAACEWARQDLHPFTLSTVLLLTGFVHANSGDAATVRAHGEEMAELSRRYELFQSTEAALLRGLADTLAGAADGAEALAAATAEYRSRGWTVFVPFLLAVQAEAWVDRNEAEKAAEALDEAAAIVERSGERMWSPEVMGLRARLADDPEAARELRRESLSVARDQGSRWLELRAALRWAREEGDLDPLRQIVAAWEEGDRGGGVAELDTARRLLA